MKIRKIYRHNLFRFIKGDNFVKGDHLFRDKNFEAKLVNGESVELSPDKIRDFYNGTRISQKRLKGLEGQEHRKFMK